MTSEARTGLSASREATARLRHPIGAMNSAHAPTQPHCRDSRSASGIGPVLW